MENNNETYVLYSTKIFLPNATKEEVWIDHYCPARDHECIPIVEYCPCCGYTLPEFR